MKDQEAFGHRGAARLSAAVTSSYQTKSLRALIELSLFIYIYLAAIRQLLILHFETNVCNELIFRLEISDQ